MFPSKFYLKVVAFLFALLSLAALNCTRAPDREKQSLYRQWLAKVRSSKEEFTRRDALIEYFSLKWHSVSFDVMADHLLTSWGKGQQENRPWPFGEAERPLGVQEAKARQTFEERYGLQPPPYFPPALDAYDFMAPPWAEAVNRSHWEKVLRTAGLNSLDDVHLYLERRKPPSPLESRKGSKMVARPSQRGDTGRRENREASVRREVFRLLSGHPGSKLEHLDAERHYMQVRLSGFLTSGTDAACAAASDLLYQLCSLEEGRFIVKVTNDWVPSTVNPMDVVWARRLAGLGGAPGVLPGEEHQRRVNRELRLRGVSVD